MGTRLCSPLRSVRESRCGGVNLTLMSARRRRMQMFCCEGSGVLGEVLCVS
jgi:hypothetical protein